MMKELGIQFAALKQRHENTEACLKDTNEQLKETNEQLQALTSAMLDGVSFQFFENLIANVSPPSAKISYARLRQYSQNGCLNATCSSVRLFLARLR